MTPAWRLLSATAGSIYVFKAWVLATRRGPRTAVGLLAFLFCWPGVIASHFRERGAAGPIDAARFLAAWARFAIGAVAIGLLAIYAPRLPERVLGLAGVAALLLTLHLGIGDLLPWFLRWAGFPAPLLFDRPWAATSLSEFWGKRWNLAFVEMNQRLFLPGLGRRLGRRLGRGGSRFVLFVLSGMLHELALSFPAGGGWGLPLGYFVLQGALVAAEKRWRIANRAWKWFWLLAPAPWLFHEAFRRALIVPFYVWLHGAIAQRGAAWYLSHAIYAAALGHLVVLVASFQAPVRLGWKQDIAKLTRFNQRIFWAYGFYILLCIVSFAGLTWRLHDALVAGEEAARWLAGFIALFWTVRVVVDLAWYDHRDWPPGNSIVLGHALLTSLFCSLAAVYWLAATQAPV